jgi:hypothetical protein
MPWRGTPTEREREMWAVILAVLIPLFVLFYAVLGWPL